MLTSEQMIKYVEDGYGNCPYCNSDQIEGGSLDFAGNEISQKIMCLECEKVWHDIYTLSGIQED